jgi:predicted ATPase/DNA-binding SARP family transcriptional activator
MAGAIQYEVLGRLTVHRADDPGTDISPRGALQRRLLCALVLRANEVVHADALADVVWPGGLPANHLAALQTHVFRLRQLLPAGSIDSEPAGYRLRAAPDDSDAQRFESGIYEAARVRVEDPGAAVARLDEMLGWWRGTPYEEVADLDDARIEAARLGELRVRAAEERSACLLDLGQHAALVVDLEALAAHHPLRERLQAQLMLALHRSGRRADALAVFERYRRALGEELGIEPSAALQQLHDDIVTGDIDERAPAPPAGGTTVAAPPSPPAGALSRSPLRPNALNEVVRYASTFVGREALVAKVAGLLERERLVTLVGTGGVGKTRAAAEVCAAVEGRFAGVLWFCELAAADASSVTLTVAAALGIDERGGVDHLVRIAEVLRAQGGLLVLDNCEHVIDEAAEMAETILSGAPDVRILATSRERLAVDGEHLLVVDPLPPPERADPGGPAVQLFVDRARAVRPEWTPDGEDLRVVADMCRHLDGLPLAIELAAARLHTLTLGEVAAGLQTRFRVLTGGRRTTARHRSLAAAVSWSYDLLSEQEQAMFDALSVFQSPFPAAGPAAVLDAEPGVAADLLSALVERSLVHRVGARYGALESIRQFGAERLAERGVTAAMRERHARYHERYVADAHDRLRRAGHTDVLEDLDASLGDLRTAQRWLAEHGSHHERLRYCVGLRDYGFYRMRPEVLGWAEEAARAAEASGYLDPLVGGGVRRGVARSVEARRPPAGRRPDRRRQPGDARVRPGHLLRAGEPRPPQPDQGPARGGVGLARGGAGHGHRPRRRAVPPRVAGEPGPRARVLGGPAHRCGRRGDDRRRGRGNPGAGRSLGLVRRWGGGGAARPGAGGGPPPPSGRGGRQLRGLVHDRDRGGLGRLDRGAQRRPSPRGPGLSVAPRGGPAGRRARPPVDDAACRGRAPRARARARRCGLAPRSDHLHGVRPRGVRRRC